MRRTSFAAAAIVSVAAIALFAGMEPAAAQRHGGGGGGGHGISAGGGMRSGGGVRSGTRSFSGSPAARSFAGSRPRGYVNRGGSERHVRHFRGGRVYGYAPFVGGYAYGGGTCAYYYRRALATGSSYWWDRYYDCVGD